MILFPEISSQALVICQLHLASSLGIKYSSSYTFQFLGPVLPWLNRVFTLQTTTITVITVTVIGLAMQANQINNAGSLHASAKSALVTAEPPLAIPSSHEVPLFVD